MSFGPTNKGAAAGLWHWSSPMPYLFGGLALMLLVIAVALVILVCSFKNSSSSPRDGEEKSVKQVELQVLDFEPKIVVIMAGDHNPSYLAMPRPNQVQFCNCHQQQEEQV